MNLIFDSHAHYDDKTFNSDRDLLLKKLTQFLNKKYLIFCSIGSETVLSCNEIDEVDISKSKNICMWIFPTDKNIQALERYSKNTVNDFIVYRLYE